MILVCQIRKCRRDLYSESTYVLSSPFLLLLSFIIIIIVIIIIYYCYYYYYLSHDMLITTIGNYYPLLFITLHAYTNHYPQYIYIYIYIYIYRYSFSKVIMACDNVRREVCFGVFWHAICSRPGNITTLNTKLTLTTDILAHHQRHFVHDPISPPERFGLVSHAPTLEAVFEDAGLKHRG